MTAGNRCVVTLEMGAEFSVCKHWQVTCCKNRMKNRDDEGIRTYGIVPTREKGVGPGSAGQSGDTQGLSDVAEAGSESLFPFCGYREFHILVSRVVDVRKTHRVALSQQGWRTDGRRKQHGSAVGWIHPTI